MDVFKPKFVKPGEVESLLEIPEEPKYETFETTSFVFNKNSGLSLDAQKENLPIARYKDHIIEAIRKYRTLILIGETGSGKSTQIPQYIIESGVIRVAVCEPRGIAAISLANRVAEEMHTQVQGQLVGYTVKWDHCPTCPKIKFVTEGILIMEMMSDLMLSTYTAVVVDEAHERTVYTDVLMGLLKNILKNRPEFRVIITSATMDAVDIYNYFNLNSTGDKSKDTACIASVEGRTHPIDILYANAPVNNYLQTTVDTIITIHKNEPPGDILAFLTGKDEIDQVMDLLFVQIRKLERSWSKSLPQLCPLPMYGALTYQEQLKVFKKTSHNGRKVVLATNIAESSVTISGIRYVIDCGYVKQCSFDTKTLIKSVAKVPISKRSADQRAGRAGREKPGKCFRLYPESEYKKMTKTYTPEICRSELTNVFLLLKALRVELPDFEFLTEPPYHTCAHALETLFALQAIDLEGNLSKLGERMAKFAIDPVYSKILLTSSRYGCTKEVIIIVAMLQAEVFAKPKNNRDLAKVQNQRSNFEVDEGDLLTLLNIFVNFELNGHSRSFCQEEYLNYKGLLKVIDIKKDLESALSPCGFNVDSSTFDVSAITKCLATGLFLNTAYLHSKGTYRTVRGDFPVEIYPTSVYHSKVPRPRYVVFTDIFKTDKIYIKNLTPVDKRELADVAPHFFNE